MNLLELEVSGDLRGSAEGVQECVMRALSAPLPPRTKILFSQRGLQYAEDYGNSIQRSAFINVENVAKDEPWAVFIWSPVCMRLDIVNNLDVFSAASACLLSPVVIGMWFITYQLR